MLIKSVNFGIFLAVTLFCNLIASGNEAHAHSSGNPGTQFVHLNAKNKFERTKIANLGVAIERVLSDSVYGTATPSALAKLKKNKVRILETFALSPVKTTDFPLKDARYHNYEELTHDLDALVEGVPYMKKFSIGKTVEGRDIWAVQFNTSQEFMMDGYASFKPGVVYMGNHHAREHLSAEIPLMFIQYLKDNADHPEISRLLQTRDIFIIPMVNPDGAEYDTDTGRYRMHRKNMRNNGSHNCIGVDLNRNYEYGWGTGGSSEDPCDETFMGPYAFSEPETQAIKNFVESRTNLTVLLSFHTFSELILYPWGHSYSPVNDVNFDHTAYVKMAKTMAQWNGYKPQQASELYIASGDTTDWAWGTQGIFSFTFELSPKDLWRGGGGFYPGAEIIDRVFADNMKPMLFLLDIADNPKRVTGYENVLDDPMLEWLR